MKEGIDIGIAIATVSPAATENLRFVKSVVKSLVDKLPTNNTRYSVIIFGDQSFTKLTFQDTFPDDTSLKTFIDGLPGTTGASNLGKALKESLKLFTNALHKRPEHSRILLIFTDQPSSGNELNSIQLAKKLDDMGVQIIAVPIDMQGSREKLERVVQTRKNIINSNKDDVPGNVAQRIVQRASRGKTFFMTE